MDFKDYYTILGLPKTATQEEIRKTYRDLARRYHPDVSKEKDAEARFKDIGEAYHVLKDPEKRARYDRYGDAWQARHERGGGGVQFGEGFNAAEFGSFFDILEHLFGREAHFSNSGFEEFAQPMSTYHGSFDSGGTFSWTGRRGEDQESTIQVTLEEAALGGQKQVTKVDPRTGHRTTYTVKIPAGTRHGERIRMTGQGGKGIGSMAPGDLYLRVQVVPSEHLRLEGCDLFATASIEPWQAALGGEVIVETLVDRVRIRVPEGTSSGDVVRVRGKGFPASGCTGDLYVEFRIVMQKTLSAQERELYEGLERVSHASIPSGSGKEYSDERV